MSMKKKLGLGIASAALGLSLIGGGTLAYFSDGATIHNGFQSGTLVLNAQKAWNFPLNFDLKDVKPGQSWERQFVLKNDGTVDIGKTFMTLTNAGEDNALLDNLVVNYFVDVTPPTATQGSDAGYILMNSQDISLRDAIAGNFAGKIKQAYLTTDGQFNLTPEGIAAGANNRYRIVIKFPDSGAPQNDLQGKTVKVDFKFDSRQTDGTAQDQNGPNNADIVNPDAE
jgi:spore coat-associated protein N